MEERRVGVGRGMSGTENRDEQLVFPTPSLPLDLITFTVKIFRRVTTITFFFTFIERYIFTPQALTTMFLCVL